MNIKYIIISMLVVLVGGAFLLLVNADLGGENTAFSSGEVGQENRSDSDYDELVACLAEAGVVIYGSVTCPFCTQLAESLGGYDMIDPIYVECPDDPERCEAEMYGRGVPEIQIEGELYQGSRDPADLAEAVGCDW